MQDRIDSLETNLGSELQALKRLHDQHFADIVTIDKQKDTVGSNCSILQDRVRYLEETVTTSVANHAKMLDTLRVAQANHEVEICKWVKSSQVSSALEQRLNNVEPMLAEAIDKHSAQLTSASSSMDKLRGRLVALEQQSNLVNDIQRENASQIQQNAV